MLQVTPALDGGGVEQLTLDVAAAVAAAHLRSLVASRGGRLESVLERSGAELVRMPVHSRNPFTMAANAARLAGLIRRRNVSLIHVRSRAPAFSALSAARATGVPLVTTYHGIYGASSSLKRWYNAIMTRGDLVIANSRFTAAHVIAEHHIDLQKVAIVPEGIDTARFNPAAVAKPRLAALRAAWAIAPGDPRTIILLPARLTWWKGHAFFIEALAGVMAREEVLLILAGGATQSDYALSIEAAAAVAGMSDQVRMVGPCDDMPAAYALADLVVAPSILPESFGRTVVEAGAMRRPVIASDLGGPAETVVHGVTGWLATPGDVEAWRAALATALAADQDARRKMGAAARTRVLRLYSLAAMCKATFDVYRRVLGGRA